MTEIPPLATGRVRKAKAVNLPKALSVGEEMFALHMKARGLSPVREFRFSEERACRADFAFPDKKLLIEVEGGIHSGGRHLRAEGFTADCAKYNLAAQLGYRVLRYTTEMISRGEAELQVVRILGVI